MSLLSRRFLAMLSASVILLGALSMPVGASAQGRMDMVVGTAQFHQYSPRIDVHVNATSGPNGEDPRGWWRYDVANGGAFDRVGKVTCLNVYGNSAILSGVVTDGHLVDTYFVQFVQDAGSPGQSGDNSLTLQYGLTEDPGCAAYTGGGTPATGGNYVVKDAT